MDARSKHRAFMAIGAAIPAQYRKRGVDTALLRRLAVEADCDPRTLAKMLAGAPVRGAVVRRIQTTLERHGLLPPKVGSGRPLGSLT